MLFHPWGVSKCVLKYLLYLQYSYNSYYIIHAGIAVSEHGTFPLGSVVSITCSSDFGVTATNWLLDGRVVSTAVGSEGELSISVVSENHHDRMYTCRATAPFGVQEHSIFLQVEGIYMHILALCND